MKTNSPRAKQQHSLEKSADLPGPKRKGRPPGIMVGRVGVRNQMLGKTYGSLTITGILYNKNRQVEATCVCGCKWVGNYTNVLNGKSTSCGCSRSPYHTKPGGMIGKTYHRLTINADDGLIAEGVCICGKPWKGSRYNVLSGDTKSCGCLQRETIGSLNYSHGHTINRRPSKVLQAWKAMHTRCYGSLPINHRYAERRIQVCKRWQDGDGVKSGFMCFLDDIGPPPDASYTVERINNDGDYEPENVRWATHKEQMNNQCRNKLLTFDGQTKTLTQWAETVGLKPGTLSSRLRVYGWTIQKALTQPLQYA